MQRNCDACGEPYIAKRRNSRFCSDTCRKRGHRGQAFSADSVSDYAGAEIVLVTKATLEQAGRLTTVLGAAAVELARSIPHAGDSAKAGLVKELRAVMAEALDGVTQAADPFDELAARRDSKQNAS